ncbi:MAG: hypothetical protein KDN18_15790 [Verrucomicrobiae bacterium]|nr:hypothetical protein [Verrucomicrobiae bacterium]
MELNDPEDVQRLIRLKRYESPGDEYFRSFSEAFKERQRAELLKQSARGLLLERFSLWFDESGGTKRFVPAGALAAAAIGAGLYLALPGEDSSPTNENFAGVPSVQAPAGAETEEEFSLELPEGKVRVPGLYPEMSSKSPSLLPAGVKGSLREL